MQFRNGFHTTPLCSPSRACFLTGQYAHRHGIIDNTVLSRAKPAPRHAFRACFTMPGTTPRTSASGTWAYDDDPRPGFDRWISFPGQGTYTDPIINDNGSRRRIPGYTTDIFTDLAIGFMRQKRSKPFCLYLAHKALHPEVYQADDGSVAEIPSLYPG